MASSADLGLLPPEDWDRLHDLANAFESAWQAVDPRRQTLDLEGFLPPPADPLRRTALVVLLKLELAARWRHGQVVGLERCLERFPELGTAQDLPAELIYEEYRVRQLHGDKPALASYLKRFPTQFAELQQLVHEHPITEQAAVAPAALAHLLATYENEAGSPVNEEQAYRLTKVLSRGAFGEVWHGVAPDGRAAVLKRVYRYQHEQEGRSERSVLDTLLGLRHRALLELRGYWLLPDRIVLALEPAEGSLRHRLEACRHAGWTGLPAAELLLYFRPVAEALDELHGRGLLHANLKPDNLLLLRREVRLADFGLAAVLPTQKLLSLTDPQAPTPLYQAPEVWDCTLGQPGPASDQYSLAISYAELRQGRRPFAGTDLIAILEEHLHGQPDLSGLTEAERPVITKAMARAPAARYGSCREFVHALDEAIHPPLERHVAPEPEEIDWQRTTTIAAVLLGLTLVAVAVGLIMKRLSERDRPAHVGTTPNGGVAPEANGLPPLARLADKLAAESSSVRRAELARQLAERVAARPKTPQQRQEAVRAFGVLHELIVQGKIELPAVALYDTVLQPTLRGGEALLEEVPDARLAKPLAQVHHATALHLRSHLHEVWPAEFAPAQRALEAFSRAGELDPHEPRYLIKRAKTSQPLPNFASAVVEDLQAILKDNPPPELAGEAHYWLGLLYQVRGNHGQAEDHFKRSMDLLEASAARTGKVAALAWAQVPVVRAEALRKADPRSDAAAEQLAEVRRRAEHVRKHDSAAADALLCRTFDLEAQWALEEAEELFAEDRSSPLAAERLKLARACAEDLRGHGDAPTAARIVGLAHELAGAPAQALAVYDQGLRSFPANAGRQHVRLWLARLELLCAERLEARMQPALPTLVSEADDLVRAAAALGDSGLRAEARAAAAEARAVASRSAQLPGVTRQHYRTEAVRHYQTLLAETTAHARRWRWCWQLGQLQRILGEAKEAQKNYLEAAKDAPPRVRSKIEAQLRELKNAPGSSEGGAGGR